MRRPFRALARAAAALAAAAFVYGASLYLTLPDVRTLAASNPLTTAFIDLRAREARLKGQEPRRVQHWVPYARISPHLKKAVLVAEDAKFWQHDGLDYEQIQASMEVNLERLDFVRGASTITQQLAKNLYLSPSRDPARKLRELWIARRLEAELSKQRILELYLNVIEWGDGIYGAEAAARTYFRKPAAALGAQESALLAGAIVNARLLDPARPTARLRRRQQMILRRMGAVEPPPPVAASAGPATDAPPEAGAGPGEPVPPAPESLPPSSLPGESVPPAPAEPCPIPPCR